MEPAVLIAIIATFAGLPATITPILLARMAARDRRLDRQEDYARQDMVAERAASVARSASECARAAIDTQNRVAMEVLSSNKEVTEVTKAAAQTGEKTLRTVQVVHTLVNSDLTDVLGALLSATTSQLMLMKEVNAIKKTSGMPEDSSADEFIQQLEHKVGELKKLLGDRANKAASVENQQEDAERSGIGRL